MAGLLGDESFRAQIQEWLAAGIPVAEIERLLQERGVNPAEAALLVDHVFANAVRTQLDNSRRLTQAGMLHGSLWCLGGIAILTGGIALFHVNGRGPGYTLFAASAAAFARGSIIIVRAVT